MNGKKLTDAFTEVDMNFIEQSEPTGEKNKKAFPIWILPVAAAFVVLIALAVLFRSGVFKNLKPQMKTTSPDISVSSTSGNINQTEKETTAPEEGTTTPDDETDGKTVQTTRSGKRNPRGGKTTDRTTTQKDVSKPVIVPGKPDTSKPDITVTTVPTEPTTGYVYPEDSDFEPGVLKDDAEYLNAVAPYAISRHQYPSYPMNPRSGIQIGDGNSTSYKEWFEGRRYRYQFLNNWQPASDFFKNSSSVFLTDNKGENALYSPANVYIALSLLAETTGGNSRSQILSALSENNITDLRERVNKIWNANYSNDGCTECLLGNSIWLNDKHNYKKETLDILAENYYASSFSGEMGSAGYNNAFRQWLNTHTGNLLSDQISSLGFDSQTNMALASTIYFKAKWLADFNKQRTCEQVFHTPKKDVSVDFMHMKLIGENLLYGDKFTAAELSLDMSGSMVFILPDEGITPEKLLKDSETLEFIVTKSFDWSKKQKSNINYSIPKFDISTQSDLIQGLEKLGISDCFDISKADFSPISDEIIGAASQVKHGVRVAIDEEGVVATAYTVELMAGGIPQSAPEYDFTLDRPFLFVIKGIDGMPLFIGIVNNPA